MTDLSLDVMHLLREINAGRVTYCNFCDVESGSLFGLSRLLSHSQNLNGQRPYSALEFMNTGNT